MIKGHARFWLLVLTTCALSSARAESQLSYEDLEWELKRDRDGVQVYTASVEGSRHKAVRAQMTVPHAVHELVALVMDTEACPEWAALCKESSVAESVSVTEAYIYTYNDLPWPVRDRDAVGHVNWSVNPDTGEVGMTARIVAGKVDPHRRALRLSEGITSWRFTPLADGSTEVVSFAHLDPGGAVPSWITNMLLVDSPFDTMVGMRTAVATGRYQNASVPFLVSVVRDE